MAKEWMISAYLFVVKVVFSCCKIFPIRKKVTFLVSFGQNSLWVYEEMLRQGMTCDVVFLYTKGCRYDFNAYPQATAIPLESKNILSFFTSMYHLATANYVIVDNYYGLLAAISFKKHVECIQLWHAAGAIKTFGLEDHSIHQRSQKARRRFRQVYKQFHKIVVGSDTMATIFKKAFGANDATMLRTGIPRTDLFFDKMKKKEIVNRLYKEYPYLNTKKVILYAPTYRDQELDRFHLQLDLDKMSAALSQDFVLWVKLHPAIKNKVNDSERYPDFVYDFSEDEDINDLLFVTDILITDYSSIACEFALLERPMIFFPYDLADYTEERGLWDDYEKLVSPPIVYTTDAIIEAIQADVFNPKNIQAFSQEWNKYSRGNSSKNLVDYIKKELMI